MLKQTDSNFYIVNILLLSICRVLYGSICMLCLHLPVLMRVSAVINCAQRYFDSWSVHFILAPTVRRHINETEAIRNGAQRLPIKTKWEKLWQQEGKTKTMPPRLTTWWLDKKRRSKQKERRAACKAKCQKYATPPSREAIAERKTKKAHHCGDGMCK